MYAKLLLVEIIPLFVCQ